MDYPSFQLCILGQRISIRCNDSCFRSLVLANYQAFQECSDSVDLEYIVGRHASGGFYISRGNELLIDETSDESIQYELIYALEKLITLDLQRHRKDLYFVHASVMERSGQVIIFAAESGTGKSTTAWALLHHGFRYLSDELAPIDPISLEVHSYQHALCLKSSPPRPYSLPGKIINTEKTLHIPVASFPSSVITNPKPLKAIVFLNRQPDATDPDYFPISPAEAAARLYANTLNALAHPGSGLNAAIRITEAVPAFTINAGDLHATCELIASLDSQL